MNTEERIAAEFERMERLLAALTPETPATAPRRSAGETRADDAPVAALLREQLAVLREIAAETKREDRTPPTRGRTCLSMGE